jgi:hypothetical protein
MNSAAEFCAALPEPHAILGLRLLPLSLGRYRLLKRFGCPFVDDDLKEIGLSELTSELFFALLVCGFPVAEFKALLDSPKQLAKEAKRFGKAAGRIIKRDRYFNILEHVAAFQRYLNEGSAAPWVVLSVQDGSDVSMAHWSSSIEVTLRAKVGWTQAEVDEEPLTKALADFFQFAEGEGMVRLYDPKVFQDMQVEARANGEAMEKILQELDHGA